VITKIYLFIYKREWMRVGDYKDSVSFFNLSLCF